MTSSRSNTADRGRLANNPLRIQVHSQMPVGKSGSRWREISIPYRSLAVVFPFFLAFDRQAKICSAGPSLEKLCAALQPDSDIETLFELLTPSTGFAFERIMEQLFTTFFIRIRGTDHVLRGQMLPSADSGSELLLFIGTPVVREMSDVSRWGLSLKDFAIHDSVVDLLLVLQAKNNTIRDIRHLHGLLEREVETRSRVEHDLHELNEELEQRVMERTLELKRSNHRLEESLTLLEENNRELHVLNKMGEMLHGSASLEESLDVISFSLGRLLPHASGFLQVQPGGADQPELSITWGGLAHDRMPHEITADCRVFQSGEAHLYRGGSDLPRCPHLKGSPECDSICMPLLANGRIFGLLSLQCFVREREPGEQTGFPGEAGVDSHHRGAYLPGAGQSSVAGKPAPASGTGRPHRPVQPSLHERHARSGDSACRTRGLYRGPGDAGY